MQTQFYVRPPGKSYEDNARFIREASQHFPACLATAIVVRRKWFEQAQAEGKPYLQALREFEEWCDRCEEAEQTMHNVQERQRAESLRAVAAGKSGGRAKPAMRAAVLETDADGLADYAMEKLG